jgi:L,D-peptidoglycan transpeptidase YkuD (ErfK/YbiS/YcfS/YnhG family)
MTRTSAAAGAADMSRTAAGAADMSRTAAMTAAAAAMTAAAAAAAAMTAAAARCKSQALAEWRLVFFVEDVEGRQANVRDFFFTENNSACVVLRRHIRCRRGC